MQLLVLKELTEKFTAFGMPDITKTAFVCIQHLLHTTIDLFQAAIDLGASPNHIFLLGKHYSYCTDVVQSLTTLGIHVQPLTPFQEVGNYHNIFIQHVNNLWHNAQQHIEHNDIDSIIILDDGGHGIELIPDTLKKHYPVITVEQTSAGIFKYCERNLSIPMVDVAKTATKSRIESHFIIDTVIQQAIKVLPSPDAKVACGIIGAGAIGTALANKLTKAGYSIIIFDQNKTSDARLPAIQWGDSIQSLAADSDYIFGCTGTDVARFIDVDQLTGEKTFISCSSEDKEFLSLLKRLNCEPQFQNQQHNPLHDISYQFAHGLQVHLLKGGYPVNFDHSGESVPARDIQLTRGLLLGALIQAVFIAHDEGNPILPQGRLMLDPSIQANVVANWRQDQNNEERFADRVNFEAFENTETIRQHSEGQYIPMPQIDRVFQQLPPPRHHHHHQMPYSPLSAIHMAYWNTQFQHNRVHPTLSATNTTDSSLARKRPNRHQLRVWAQSHVTTPATVTTDTGDNQRTTIEPRSSSLAA